ncbi:MAG: PEP-utilizing enzyme [Pseudomonadota bacterium]
MREIDLIIEENQDPVLRDRLVKIKNFVTTWLDQDSFITQNNPAQILKSLVSAKNFKDVLDFSISYESDSPEASLETLKGDIIKLHDLATGIEEMAYTIKRAHELFDKYTQQVIESRDQSLILEFIDYILHKPMDTEIFRDYVLKFMFNVMSQDHSTLGFVLPRLIVALKIYGYTATEAGNRIIRDIMDLINSEPAYLQEHGYFLRILFALLTKGLSGQDRVGPDDPLRVRTRSGIYGVGIHGVLRDSIHDYLGIYCIGQLERALEYWRTGDKNVLIDPDYRIDVFGKAVLPNIPFPKRVIIDESKPSKETKQILTVLFRELKRRKIKGNNDYERLINASEQELADIYSSISKTLHLKLPLSTQPSGSTLTAYIWAYREIITRYGLSSTLESMAENMRCVGEIYPNIWRDTIGCSNFKDGKLYAQVLSGNYLDAIEEIIVLRKRIKELIFTPSPYNKGEILDDFIRRYGRDDTGNADGGAFYQDKKLALYFLEKYLTSLEEHILKTVIAEKFHEINDENLEDALQLIQKMVAINRNKDINSVSVEDDALLLVSKDSSYTRARDLVEDIVRVSTNNIEALSETLKYTGREIVSNTSSEAIDNIAKKAETAVLSPTEVRELLLGRLIAEVATHDASSVLLPRFAEKVLDSLERKIKSIDEKPVKGRKDYYIYKDYDPDVPDYRLSRYYLISAHTSPDEIKAVIDHVGRGLMCAKGIGEARVALLGINTPPFIIFPVGATQSFVDKSIASAIDAIQDHIALYELQYHYGARYADTENPLFFSVRGGGFFTMPGQLPTVTNIGMSEKKINLLAARFMGYGLNRENALWSAWDSYRRFLEEYAEVVLDIRHETFDVIIESMKRQYGVQLKENLTWRQMQNIAQYYKKKIEDIKGKNAIPIDPRMQLNNVIHAVKASWPKTEAYRMSRNITGDWGEGTIVMLQAMVYGNIRAPGESGSGVVYSREPNTYRVGMYGDYKTLAQGRDLADHISLPYDIRDFQRSGAEWFGKLDRDVRRLDYYYCNTVVEIEVTLQNGTQQILQVREAYTLKSKYEFLFQPPAAEIIGRGRPSSGGAYRGLIVYLIQDLSKNKLITMYQKALEMHLDGLIMVCDELEPSHRFIITQEIKGESHLVVGGLITKRGGIASHSADIARDTNIACIVATPGLEWNEKKAQWSINSFPLEEGAVISIDGSRGIIAKGAYPLKPKNNSGFTLRYHRTLSDI